jgi:putative phage-type endonuclease
MDKLILGPIEIVPHAQGSEAWIAERAKPMTCCASEAAAALGVSPHLTRDQLIAKMAMGHEKEFSDYVRKQVLERGHVSERSAREILEAEIGELAPLTLTRTVNGMRWLASLDGQTMDEQTLFEHKDWNQELVASLKRGEVPIDKACQMEQQLVVSGSEVVKFVCSDGTAENRIVFGYRSDPALLARLVAAWELVLKEAQAYTAAPATVEVVAKTITALPALSLQVEGKMVASNLAAYKPQALAYIAAINTVLKDDQHFADAKADAKFCRDSADKLELVVEQVIGQMGDINTAITAVREIAEAFDKKALLLEKAVESETKAIKEAEITRGRTALQQHILDLNQQLGMPYMPAIAHDFVNAAKNVRTVESLRNRINTHLADCKLLANEKFGGINRNLTWLRENAQEFKALFQHDTATIVLKAHDDLVALAQNRINEHKQAEAKRLEQERERIRAEEVARLAREQEARDREAARIEREQEAARQAELRREQESSEAAARASAPAAAPAQPIAATPIAAPASAPQAPAANSPTVVPLRAAAPTIPPSLKLGDINARLEHFTTSEAGLAALGFPATHVKGARLYHEADFPRMLDSMVAHLRMVAEQQLQAA